MKRSRTPMTLASCLAVESFLAMTLAPVGSYLSAATLPCDSCAAIVNSGSTNAAGFRIIVEKSGNAEYTVMPRRARPQGDNTTAKPVQRKVPDALVRRLYADLEAARPLSGLPYRGCFKSVSFGTKVTIEVGKEVSPDLSCPEEQDAHIQALMRDVDEIVRYFPKSEAR
jgi:hypothetical protein